MRKISKTRVDDEAISSTNGSFANDVDDQPEAENQAKENEESEPEANKNGGNEDDADEVSDSELNDKRAKKRKSRSKAKGTKKSAKKTKDEEDPDEDVEEEYEVEKIVDSKKIKGKLHYLIRWKGYSADSDTWEPENTVSCPNLVTKFNEEVQKKIKEPAASSKKGRPKKRKGKEPKTPAKKPKNEWDSENADKNEEYEVDRILEVHFKKNGKKEFLIHWKGWSNKFDSWEPESNLNCKELIKKFMEKAPSSGRRLSKRRGQRQRVRYDDAE